MQTWCTDLPPTHSLLLTKSVSIVLGEEDRTSGFIVFHTPDVQTVNEPYLPEKWQALSVELCMQEAETHLPSR